MPLFFGEKILDFNRSLDLHLKLPSGIKAMNPFKGKNHNLIEQITREFYNKYYSDINTRKIILGINPGRFGAGVTGIPFTDTKRLMQICGIHVDELKTYEPSSVFIYEVIEAFGGVDLFYSKIFITSLCPLGFVKTNEKGKEVNFNFYDQKDLEEMVKPFIVDSLKTQLEFGVERKNAILLGTGKNFKFFEKLNLEYGFFENIIPVEHPRYVMQYKHKLIPDYVQKYLVALNK